MTEPARGQTRARYPDSSGYAERDGVRLYYEVYGSGEPAVLLLPTWSVIHSRHWKMQIPYLARHCLFGWRAGPKRRRVMRLTWRDGLATLPVAAAAVLYALWAADALMPVCLSGG